MPDFLTTLAQRTLKTVPVIQPIIAPLFSPDFPEASAPVEEETWNTPAHAPNQADSDPTLHKPRATVPPTSAHTEEVLLNQEEVSPGIRPDDKVFGKSGIENDVTVGVRGGVERRSFPSAERPDAQHDEPPVSALDQGARKVTPLPSSLIQELQETNVRNDIYPKDYRNNTMNLPIREKDVEGTNSLPEQFELVQRTGMAIPPVLRSPEASDSSLLIGEPHQSVPLYIPGSSKTSSQIQILPLTHEQHGIINGTPTPDAFLPGNGVHRQRGIINGTPTPDVSLPGNGNGVLNNNAAALLDVSSNGRTLDDDSTLFSTEIAPFHPLQSTNIPGSLAHSEGSDRDSASRITTSTTLAVHEPIRSHTPPTPTVHITIGRIDVRAITTQTPETRRSPGKTRSSLSLDDYMNKQNKGEH